MACTEGLHGKQKSTAVPKKFKPYISALHFCSVTRYDVYVLKYLDDTF